MVGQIRERGLRAPAWLEELVRTTPPPVPWRDVIRFAVTIPAPLAVAIAVEGGVEPGPALGAGVFATMGALAGTLAPQSGPLRDRLRRIAAATLFGAVGLLVGQFATGGGWAPVVLIAVLSAIAALISSVNAALSLGALQLLVYTALASARSVPLADSRSAIAVKTAATEVRSGSSASVLAWIRVVRVAQAAPQKKKATSTGNDSGVSRPEASAV